MSKYMAIHCSTRSPGCTPAACMTLEMWATTLATPAVQTEALSLSPSPHIIIRMLWPLTFDNEQAPT